MYAPFNIKKTNRSTAMADIIVKHTKPKQVFGPYSIYSVFHPLLLGANGKTLNELKQLLGVEYENLLEIYKDFLKMDKELKSTNELKRIIVYL